MVQPLLTVVIIAADDGSNEQAYKEMENDILRQRFTSNVRYIIYKYNSNTKPDQAVSKRLVQNWMGRVRFEERAEPDASDRQFYEPRTLTAFLKRVHHSVKDNPNHKYLLITWGHGAGLGFFTSIEDIPDKVLPEGWEERGRKYYISQYKSLLWSESYVYNNLGIDNGYDFVDDQDVPLKRELIDYLRTNSAKGISAKHFAEIITNGIGKADCLLCINCFSLLLETVFYLRPAVQVLTASQTIMPFTGIHYGRLFSFINESKNHDANLIGKNIVYYFRTKYLEKEITSSGSSPTEATFDIKRTFICAADLSTFDPVFESLNKILDFFINHHAEPTFSGSTLGLLLQKARRKCLDTSSFLDVDFIDIKSYLQHIAFYISDETFKNEIGRDELNRIYEEDFSAFDVYTSESTIAENGSVTLYDYKDVLKAESASPRFASIFFPVKNLSARANRIQDRYFKEPGLQAFPPIEKLMKLRQLLFINP